MEIHNQRVNIPAQFHIGLDLISRSKGVGIFSHKQIGHDVDHPQPQTCCILHNCAALPGQAFSHIDRPDQFRLAGHVRRDFRLVKHMIACGQNINAAGKQLITYRRGHAKAAGRILAIHNHEITAQLSPQTGHLLNHRLSRRPANNVP